MDTRRHPPMSVGIKKRHTFSGCWTCRKRKVKCDEGRPACWQCQKGNRHCGGYSTDLVWVDPTDSKAYTPNGRRFLRTDLTWTGHKVLHSDDVDSLLAQMDEDTESEPTSMPNSPFQVFPLDEHSRCHTRHHLEQTKDTRRCSPEEHAVSYQGGGLSDLADFSECDAYLFHHYSTYMTTIMCPFEAVNSPRKESYPLAAAGVPFLMQAFLALAATNLANLRDHNRNLILIAREKYAKAVSDLRAALSSGLPVNCSPVACTILTLCITDVLAGEPVEWIRHLNGAWGILLDEQERSPWLDSDLSRSCMQTICLLKIVADTNKTSHSLSSREQTTLNQALTHRRGSDDAYFGCSEGATPEILSMISDVTLLASKVRSGMSLSSLHQETNDIRGRMKRAREQACSTLSPEESSPMSSQRRMFVAATDVYFRTTVFDAPRTHLGARVSEILNIVQKNCNCAGQTTSLWPVFIAAVEAVDPIEMTWVETWLEGALSKGMENRNVIARIIREVWKRRMREARVTYRPVCEVRLDWRTVMQDLNCNVLLF